MGKLRKFVAYRTLERPYTRKSKYKNKNFVRSSPPSRVVRFNMGDINGKFDHLLNLVAESSLQIRHNAIESARQTCNRLLETTLGKNGYFMRVKIYPHHVLRENALASGAGADRLSTGMQKPFGKSIGIAAQVRKGHVLIEAKVNKNNIALARKALHRAAFKIPCNCSIKTTKIQ